MLDQVIVIGFLIVALIISAPLYIIMGIIILGEILEVKEMDEEYRRNQSRNTNQNEKE